MSESESTELVSDSTTWREGVALGTVARDDVDAGLLVGVAKRRGSWRLAQAPLELALARSWPALRAQLDRWRYEWPCGIKAVNGAMMGATAGTAERVCGDGGGSYDGGTCGTRRLWHTRCDGRASRAHVACTGERT